MRPISDRPVFSSVVTPGEIQIEQNATFVFELNDEPRSQHVLASNGDSSLSNYVEIKSVDRFTIQVQGEEPLTIPLRSRAAIENTLNMFGGDQLYIDITGMPHNTWAPLVKVAFELGKELKVVYAEPEDYNYSDSPREGQIFDLSSKIEGLGPIPLFAHLTQEEETRTCLVALLGFEGTRFAFLVEQLQPPKNGIVPIVGVPGYRPEYPTYTLLGNANTLQQTRAHHELRCAKSNCPFSLYYALEAIMDNKPDTHFKIGLIGTKPHALGAVMMAINQPSKIELVYDQAIRSPNRTSGTSCCHIYDLGAFRQRLVC